MRRHRTLLALLFSFALVAAACGGDDEGGDGDGGGGSTDSECPVDAFEDATGPTDVTIWSSYVGKTEQTLEQLAADYNASQDKVKVTVEVQGNSYAELLRKFERAIPTGKLPAITIGEDTNTQYMIDSGVVLPAQACMDADEDPRANPDILPVIKESYTVDGVQYPASMNVSTIVLYFNREHFVKAGLDPSKPPTTLAEVQEYARKLKASGASTKPFVMKMDPWFVEHWMTGGGQAVVDQNNGRDALAEKSEFKSDEATEIFDWLKSMNDEGLLNAVPGTDGQIDHYLAMATNGSSMLIETSAAITTINSVLEGNFDPKELGSDLQLPPGFKVTIDLGVAANPGLDEPGKGQVGGGAWYITNTGTDEVQSAAWDFVKFFNETANQVTWTIEGSYLPIVANANEDPALEADWTTTNRGKWLSVAYDSMLTLDPDFPGPVIGPYAAFRDTVRKAMEQVTLQGGDPATAINEADASITSELQNYADTNF